MVCKINDYCGKRVCTRRGRIPSRSRSGITLLEVLLSIALTAVVAAMIGSLVNIYLHNETVGRDRVEQTKLARSVLGMIADDIRATIRYEEFDASGLAQILSGDASASGSASSANSDLSALGGTGLSGTDSGSSASSSSASSSGTSVAETMAGLGTTAGLPPGIYGSQYSIEIDISRLPRPDEYFPLEPDQVSGTAGDMPSDVKTVSYYVQQPREDGVRDPLGGLERVGRQSVAQSGASGLVRRSVDRAVTQYAYINASTDSIQRTGEIIAPEVVAIEFQYFDGTTWQLQWDSSVLGLPRVVKISIALQRESKFLTNPIEPGFSLNTVTTEMMREHGLDVYSINTIIPGVHVLPIVDPTGTATSSLGF